MAPPRRVQLKSKPASIRFGAVSQITIAAHGAIKDPPEKFLAAQDEIVVWGITNSSGENVTVKFKEFLRKKHLADAKGDSADPVTPFVWLVSDTLQLANGMSGVIAGRVNYTRRDFVDGISYTIEVVGSSFAFDYDPDGDIKP
jgi:hypothetical protein